jgi:lipopolysaccharide export system ATP-binding protein
MMDDEGAAGRGGPLESEADASGLMAIGIGKSYRQRQVVREVSLSLRRGEVVGLLGPNGAGKTTCFYMITGLVRVDYGNILIDGQDVTSLPMFQRARLGVGYLPQEPSIFRDMTVYENIMCIAELTEKDKTARKEAVESLLHELHIEGLRDQPALALSGGERRRVEIARALATRPSFMLLDEPFAGIDPLAINDIHDLILFLKNRGIGILITDHNVRETLEIVDRAAIIFDGSVLFEGSPEEVRGNETVRKVYLGERFTN